MKFFHMWW